MATTLEQATEQLLRAAEIMEKAERARLDTITDATSAGWQGLQERAKEYGQRNDLQGRVALNATPAGQQLQQDGLAMKSEMSNAQMQLQLQALQAQIAHLGTPQGKAQHREGQDLQQQVLGAQSTLARQQEIANYGRLNVAMKDATQGFNLLKAVIGAVEGAVLGVASIASPAVVATYTGSWDMVSARLGRVFLPALESASQSLQNFAKLLDTPVAKGTISAVGAVGGASVSASPTGVLLNPSMIMRPWLNSVLSFAGSMNGRDMHKEFDDKSKEFKQGSWWKRGLAAVVDFGFGEQTPLKKSLAGLPPSRISSFDQYHDRLQTAALNADDPQTDVLKQQLEVLASMKMLLTQIDQKTPAAGEVVGWR